LTSLLILQLIVSFIAGGFLITLQSLIAEKTSEHISGIIMMFPTTIVLGFLFLGITTSAEHVSLVVPATLIPLGIVVFSSIVYTYGAIFFSKYFKTKPKQIIATFLTSSVVWFILAAPFAYFKFSNLIIGCIGFFSIIIISQFILNKALFKESIPRVKYTKLQILLRALFTGTIIVVVVLLGKLLNPFWGGIFTMFPAATFATLITLNIYYEPQQLFYFMKKAPLGSLSLFIYALVAMITFPKYGLISGTIISYSCSALFSSIIIKIKLHQQMIK
jgi:hypothetical protein